MANVAPHMGAWIEIIGDMSNATAKQKVAPHMGAWIEIIFTFHDSLSSGVAPHMGAWIEIKPDNTKT